MSFAKLTNFGKEKNILLDHPLTDGVPTLSEQTGPSWVLPGVLLVRQQEGRLSSWRWEMSQVTTESNAKAGCLLAQRSLLSHSAMRTVQTTKAQQHQLEARIPFPHPHLLSSRNHYGCFAGLASRSNLSAVNNWHPHLTVSQKWDCTTYSTAKAGSFTHLILKQDDLTQLSLQWLQTSPECGCPLIPLLVGPAPLWIDI